MEIENRNPESLPEATPSIAEETQSSLPETAVQIDYQAAEEAARRQKQITIIAIVIAVVVLAAMITAIVLLLQPSTDTAKIRDVFIIVMALESLIIGLSLIILMVQLARLINLLQNEIKPILDSTNETVNTLRGTTIFLGDNLVEPVVKMNEYVAALQSLFNVIGLTRRKKD